MKRKLLLVILSIALTLALIPTLAAYADDLDQNAPPVLEDVQDNGDAPEDIEEGDQDEEGALEDEELPKINLKSPVTQLSGTEANLGTEITLIARIGSEPVDATLITWTSGNVDVATVSDDGIVTVVGVGKVTITATMADGTALDGYAKIFVFPVKDNPADAHIGNAVTGHDVVAPEVTTNGKKHK